MKASDVVVWGLVAIVGLLLLKKTGLLPIAPGNSITSAQIGGTQTQVPKSDFATALDDLTSIFASATSRAQTAPKTT